MLLPAPMIAHHPVLPSTAEMLLEHLHRVGGRGLQSAEDGREHHPVDAGVAQRVDDHVRETAAVVDLVDVLADDGERGVDGVVDVDGLGDHGVSSSLGARQRSTLEHGGWRERCSVDHTSCRRGCLERISSAL